MARTNRFEDAIIQRVIPKNSAKFKRLFAGIIFFWLAGFIRPKSISAQFIAGARMLGLGQTTVAVPENRWAVFNNPAMVLSSSLNVSFYGIRNYGFSELTDMAATITYPVLKGITQAGMHHYGNKLFNKTRIRLGYGSHWEQLYFGLVVNYTQLSIERYGNVGAFGVDAGVGAQLVDGFWIGAFATNLNRSKLGASKDDMTRLLAIGFSYAPDDRYMFTSDLVKDVRFPISWRGGAEIKIIGGLQGRAGVSTQPTTFSMGIGIKRDKWEVNVAVQRHQVLGLSPGLDFSLSI